MLTQSSVGLKPEQPSLTKAVNLKKMNLNV